MQQVAINGYSLKDYQYKLNGDQFTYTGQLIFSDSGNEEVICSFNDVEYHIPTSAKKHVNNIVKIYQFASAYDGIDSMLKQDEHYVKMFIQLLANIGDICDNLSKNMSSGDRPMIILFSTSRIAAGQKYKSIEAVGLLNMRNLKKDDITKLITKNDMAPIKFIGNMRLAKPQLKIAID